MSIRDGTLTTDEALCLERLRKFGLAPGSVVPAGALEGWMAEAMRGLRAKRLVLAGAAGSMVITLHAWQALARWKCAAAKAA